MIQWSFRFETASIEGFVQIILCLFGPFVFVFCIFIFFQFLVTLLISFPVFLSHLMELRFSTRYEQALCAETLAQGPPELLAPAVDLINNPSMRSINSIVIVTVRKAFVDVRDDWTCSGTETVRKVLQ